MNNVQLARQVPMEKAIDAGKWTIMKPEMVRSTSKILTSPGLFSVRVDKSALAPSQTRLLWFTEQKFQWMLPLGDSQNVHASTVSENGIIHVLATNPSMLFSIDVKSNGLSQTHLDGHLQYYGAPDNRLSIFSLKNRLLIYDSEASRLLLVDVDNRKVEPISMKSPSNTLERLSQRWIASSEKQESLILAAILPQSGDAVGALSILRITSPYTNNISIPRYFISMGETRCRCSMLMGASSKRSNWTLMYKVYFL